APAVRPHVLAHADVEGLAREDAWLVGVSEALPPGSLGNGGAPRDGAPSLLPKATVTSNGTPPGNASAPKASTAVAEPLAKVREEVELDEDDITALFAARGRDLGTVLAAADALRREVCGDGVSYVVTRNINYTNV